MPTVKAQPDGPSKDVHTRHWNNEHSSGWVVAIPLISFDNVKYQCIILCDFEGMFGYVSMERYYSVSIYGRC